LIALTSLFLPVCAGPSRVVLRASTCSSEEEALVNPDEQTFVNLVTSIANDGYGGQMSKKKGLADPTQLKPFDAEKQMLRVVIETPKGSRNKFAFDPDHRIFELKKVLPAGMTFPYDFGFIPSTKAGDGDPIDVLVLMDEPAFPGCSVTCRPIGVIEGEQGDKKNQERNDRIVAVQRDAHSWEDIRTVDDLGKQFILELEQFFINYHELTGKEYRVLGLKGPDQARRLVKSGRR
jgi:inorganic pyrophosphatase